MDLRALRLKHGITRGWDSVGQFPFVISSLFFFFFPSRPFFFLVLLGSVYDLVSFLTLFRFPGIRLRSSSGPDPNTHPIVVLQRFVSIP